MFINVQYPLDTIPRNFPVEGEVASRLPASRCNGIWETIEGTMDFCPRQLVTNLLRTCCVETVVIDSHIIAYYVWQQMLDI